MQQTSNLLLKAVRALTGVLVAAALLPAQPMKSPAEIYRSVGDAVVLIQGATKSGSGVVIASDDMMIVTNFHVIAGEKSVTVKFADGRVLTTDELWGSDQQRDLAFLSVTGHSSGRAD